MSHIFEQQLSRIRENLIMMSSLVDRNISLAMRALENRDDSMADLVITEDDQIDKMELTIDDMVVTYMATHGPIATDSRFMLVASKISSDLERVADQAVKVARRCKELNKEPMLKPLIDIKRMCDIAQSMVRESIAEFVNHSPEKAREIIARDKEVDELNRQLQRELTAYMIEDPRTITRALNLMRIAGAWERMADHAKNIAEDVYFLYQARDIRHPNVIGK